MPRAEASACVSRDGPGDLGRGVRDFLFWAASGSVAVEAGEVPWPVIWADEAANCSSCDANMGAASAGAAEGGAAGAACSCRGCSCASPSPGPDWCSSTTWAWLGRGASAAEAWASLTGAGGAAFSGSGDGLDMRRTSGECWENVRGVIRPGGLRGREQDSGGVGGRGALSLRRCWCSD